MVTNWGPMITGVSFSGRTKDIHRLEDCAHASATKMGFGSINKRDDFEHSVIHWVEIFK